jgi:hypothetical protein
MVKRVIWLILLVGAVGVINGFDANRIGLELSIDAYAQSLFPRYLIDCTERLASEVTPEPEVMQCILFNRFTGQLKVFQITPDEVTLLSDTRTMVVLR